MCLRAGLFFVFFFNLGKQTALSAVVLYDLLGKRNQLHSDEQPLLGGGTQVSLEGRIHSPHGLYI